MTFLVWNWMRKNVNLILLLLASACLAWALGDLIRGAKWSLLLPVSLSAVVCGWGISKSRLSSKQIWASLIGLGIPGVFIYVGGLVYPLGRLGLSLLSLIPQFVLWLSDRIPVDASLLSTTWAELMRHLASLFIRLWEWASALIVGNPIVDPLAAGMVWNLLLWLIGTWAGWKLRKERQALQALAPGMILLALVLDYSRGDTSLLVVYLALLLGLMGLSRDEWRHVQWGQRKVDYAESIRLDTLMMVGMVTIALTLSAAGTPSISWRELLEKLRKPEHAAEDRVAESLGLEPSDEVVDNPIYLSDGLPRSHLLTMPPEQLQEVVLTVSTGDLPPTSGVGLEVQPQRYYWRSITFDIYSGGGWRTSRAVEVPLSANTPLLEFPLDYRLVRQHVKRVPGQGNSAYWTGVLAQADSSLDVAWRTKPPGDPTPAHNGDMLGALTNPDEYTVISYLPQVDADQLREAGSDYPPEIASRYLKLPEEVPERVLALAHALTQAAPTPYDRALAIEAYLRTFPYTLEVEPPPVDRDVVDYFLFTAQQGYCDYYASSMVVLARAVGLPARVVIGYASGDYDASSAEYIVRQKDAHSWPEVYFPGIGWVEFEPTAGQPEILRARDDSASGPPSGLPIVQSAITRLKTSWLALISNLGGQFLIALIGFILLFSLWQVGEMGYLRLIPSQRAIKRIYARIENASVRLIPDLPGGHTPHQLGIALTYRLMSAKNRLLRQVFSPVEIETENLLALYTTQVFSAHPPTRSQTRMGVRTWARLRWRLWLAKLWARYL